VTPAIFRSGESAQCADVFDSVYIAHSLLSENMPSFSFATNSSLDFEFISEALVAQHPIQATAELKKR